MANGPDAYAEHVAFVLTSFISAHTEATQNLQWIAGSKEDVLNAEQNLYNAIADYADARFNYVINLLSLHRQAGVLDAQDIAELNAFLVEEGQVNFTLPEQGEADEYDAVLDIGAPPRQDG